MSSVPHEDLISQHSVVIYTTRFCPFCVGAKRLLNHKGVRFEEVPVDTNPSLRAEMTHHAGGRTSVPQVWINQKHVGGYDDLDALDRSGELDQQLGLG